jgi:hypothetical protein
MFHLTCSVPACLPTCAAIVMGILVSQCVGAAMAAGFLSMDGIAGLRGWQWLFLIEGLMCICVSAYWW